MSSNANNIPINNLIQNYNPIAIQAGVPIQEQMQNSLPIPQIGWQDPNYLNIINNIPTGIDTQASSQHVPAPDYESFLRPQAPQLTPEEMQARFNAYSTPVQEPQSQMQQRGGNLLQNAINDIRQIGTGLSYVYTHPGELLNSAVDYVRTTPIQEIPTDIANSVLEPYNIDLRNMEGRTIGDVVGGVLQGAYEHPIYAASDALSLGAGGAIRKGLTKLPDITIPIGKGKSFTISPRRADVANKIENAINVEKVDATPRIMQLDDKLKKVRSIAKEDGVDLSRVVRGAEEGVTVSKNEKRTLHALKEFSDDYDNFAKEYSPSTHIDPREVTIAQGILRDRINKGIDTSYEAVRREIVPILESGEDISKLAKSGNSVAKEVAKYDALYKKGRAFPVTHALASVEEATSTLAKAASGEAAERAGQLSNRLWGTSPYEEIARALDQRADELMTGLSRQYIDRRIANGILNGELGGFSLGAQKGRGVKYLDRALLEEGQLDKALRGMRAKKLNPDDVEIDLAVADELNKQLLNPNGGAVNNATKEIAQIGKQVMLAQGTYLGANAITGATNAIMNSGAFIVNDIIDALKSKGNLAKQAGVYQRRPIAPRTSDGNIIASAASAIKTANYRAGGKHLQLADRALQNTFSEIALHAQLRKQGIPFGERAEAFRQMDKIKLGQVITDAKRTALLNSRNTPGLNPQMAQALEAVQPFYRWNVTALQSSIDMLKRNPIMANVVLQDILANVGFDKEMQNRLQIGANFDKPYVSFKIDPKTGNMRQMSAEFVPLTTTLKMFDPEGSDALSPSMPVWSAMINAFQGKDRYGNFAKRALGPNGEITRVVGNRRMQYDPRTGQFKELKGQGDEILSSVVTSILGPVNLWNRTAGPLSATLFGEGGKFYQPYPQSILGSYTRDENQNNLLVGGNAMRARSAGDVMNILRGVYERDYIPYFEEGQMGKRDTQSFFRGYGRDQLRRMYEQP